MFEEGTVVLERLINGAPDTRIDFNEDEFSGRSKFELKHCESHPRNGSFGIS